MNQWMYEWEVEWEWANGSRSEQRLRSNWLQPPFRTQTKGVPMREEEEAPPHGYTYLWCTYTHP